MFKLKDMKFVKPFDLLIHLIVIVGVWVKYGWAIGLFCGSVIITLDQILSVLRYRMMEVRDEQG